MSRWPAFAITLLLAVLPWSVPATEEELLPPEEAFGLASGTAEDGIWLEWNVAPGYYLYRSKFRFRTDTDGVELGEAAIPHGEVKEDEFFGKVEILRGNVRVTVPVSADSVTSKTMTLHATSQGCADLGVCYPPFTQTVSLDLPATPAAAPSAAADPLAALAQFGQSFGSGEDDEFLDPEVAFVLDAEVRDAHTVALNWQIADGYYLYRDKFKVEPIGDRGVALGPLEMPPGKRKQDEYFGEVEVYYHQALATVELRRETAAATDLELKVGYQGCADAGLCYPPITKTVALALPAATAPTGGAPPASAVPIALEPLNPLGPETPVLAEPDRLARLITSGNIWVVLLSFFGFGLALAFTPCVFPMVPILSSIIVGQGDGLTTARAFALSLVYVLAMALTYTVAGIIAGLFGHNLQAIFQDPWVLGTFSAVFVLLALSMFGFYDLQVPSSWQTRLAQLSHRQEGGTFVGVGIMGFLSALIVGPCVAAPLAAALIVIGSSGDPVRGGLTLFALSMGMGAPLLVIGASAGKLLPRAGVWMDVIKAIFGVLLLAVAIYLLERIIPGWVTMLLWAVLLVVSGIYMGALDTVELGASGWRRLWKGAGLVLVLYGALLMIGAAGGGRDVFQPLKGVFAVAGTPGAQLDHGLPFQQVKGTSGVDAALSTAAGRTVMLDFYADWCISCKEMERYTFSDPEVQSLLADSVVLQTDVTDNDAADQALLKQYGLFGPPAILFFGPEGRERPGYRVVGYMGAEDFRAHLAGALQ